MLNSLGAIDSWSRKMVWRRQHSEQPLKDDMNRRRIEIIRDMLSEWKQGVDREKMDDDEYRAVREVRRMVEATRMITCCPRTPASVARPCWSST